MLAFDGNPDVISKVEIRYHRNTKIKPGVISPEATWEYVTWDYNEQLTLDREAETLEHIREFGPGCKVTNTYYVQEGVTNLLDGLDIDVFSEIEGNPPDAVDNPLESKDYEITVYTKHGEKRTVTGTFDKKGLPNDWPEFINDVHDFMAFYGIGEVFDERVYSKTKRRPSDYIFCNVIFEDGGRTYCYLADNDSVDEGDLVVVPAGSDNHEAIVKIESIEYHPAENAPFPLEKAKHILRKCTENDLKED